MWDWFVKNWLGWIVSLVQTGIAGLMGFLWKREKQQTEILKERLAVFEVRLKISEEVDRLSLYRCIDEDHEKCMQEKCISKSRLNNLTKMARAYKDLEGDDPIIEKMIADLAALPHKPKNEEVENVR